MVVRSNKPAANSSRHVTFNNAASSKSLEKLSSGYRINRSADDAAGLAISEKMRGQIRGLSMARSNIENGVSLVKTTDGAMQEAHNMLQRIRELLVQGGNGTFEVREDTITGTCGKEIPITIESDRKMIQLEIDQLMQELDDLSYRADFNGIKILRGSYDMVRVQPDVVINTGIRPGSTLGGLPAWATIGNTNANGYMQPGDVLGAAWNATATIDFSSLTPDNVEDLLYGGFQTTCCTCTGRLSFLFNNNNWNGLDTAASAPLNGSGAMAGSQSYVFNVDISGIKNGEELVKRIMDTLAPVGRHLTDLAVDPCNPAVLIVHDTRPAQNAPLNNEQGLLRPGVWYEPGTVPDFSRLVPVPTTQNIVIQSGANNGERINVPLTTVDTLELGLRGKSGTSIIGVIPQSIAPQSIILIDEAVNMLSGKRAEIGAIQNRLEHALNNVGTMLENQTASESNIRDLDMAKEMMEFTKNNILLQSSQSMLAQANQLPQGVLSLLR